MKKVWKLIWWSSYHFNPLKEYKNAKFFSSKQRWHTEAAHRSHRDDTGWRKSQTHSNKLTLNQVTYTYQNSHIPTHIHMYVSISWHLLFSLLFLTKKYFCFYTYTHTCTHTHTHTHTHIYTAKSMYITTLKYIILIHSNNIRTQNFLVQKRGSTQRQHMLKRKSDTQKYTNTPIYVHYYLCIFIICPVVIK